MPDITMCLGEGCPQKAQCYRHTAIPSKHRQSYFVMPPHTEIECLYFTSNQQMEKQDGTRITEGK